MTPDEKIYRDELLADLDRQAAEDGDIAARAAARLIRDQATCIADLEGQQDADMRDLIKAEVLAQVQIQARNDALREAAHECEQVAYSGKYPQDDQSELGCLRCRDNVLAMIEGDTND